jgi:hypothetical protein
MLLEHQPHGFKKEFRAEIEHREIFVVERLGDGRLRQLAIGEVRSAPASSPMT